MNQILSIDKPVGVTPLEIIKQLRIKKPEFAKETVGYAGRLDPLAHGLLLLMIGDATKKRAQYLSLPKTYEFTLVFGLQTDTYDLLGYLTETIINPAPKKVNLFVKTFVNNHIGKQIQSYPPYSSKTVAGKPLFWYAKNNKLAEIEIPNHEIKIFDFKCLSIGELTLQELRTQIVTAVSVKGDFRQEEIQERWHEFFQKNEGKQTLPTATFRITCSSGTYIRELVNQLGNEAGCGAIAIDIFRTGVGHYTITDAMRL